jgi:hypothetical protein
LLRSAARVMNVVIGPFNRCRQQNRQARPPASRRRRYRHIRLRQGTRQANRRVADSPNSRGPALTLMRADTGVTKHLSLSANVPQIPLKEPMIGLSGSCLAGTGSLPRGRRIQDSHSVFLSNPFCTRKAANGSCPIECLAQYLTQCSRQSTSGGNNIGGKQTNRVSIGNVAVFLEKAFTPSTHGGLRRLIIEMNLVTSRSRQQKLRL